MRLQFALGDSEPQEFVDPPAARVPGAPVLHRGPVRARGIARLALVKEGMDSLAGFPGELPWVLQRGQGRLVEEGGGIQWGQGCHAPP